MPAFAARAAGGRNRAAELRLPRPEGTRSSLVADVVGDHLAKERSNESRARVVLAADVAVTRAAGARAVTIRATVAAATVRTERGLMSVCTSVVVLALSPVKALCQQSSNRVRRTFY